MDTGDLSLRVHDRDLMTQILLTLQSIQSDYRQLSTAIDTIKGRLNTLAGIKQLYDAAGNEHQSFHEKANSEDSEDGSGLVNIATMNGPSSLRGAAGGSDSPKTDKHAHSESTASSRIILTTYPGQSGIDPLVMDWGNPNPLQRGPVVVSRTQSTVRRRNGTRTTLRPKLYILTVHPDSDWRSWWFILNLPRASRR